MAAPGVKAAAMAYAIYNVAYFLTLDGVIEDMELVDDHDRNVPVPPRVLKALERLSSDPARGDMGPDCVHPYTSTFAMSSSSAGWVGSCRHVLGALGGRGAYLGVPRLYSATTPDEVGEYMDLRTKLDKERHAETSDGIVDRCQHVIERALVPTQKMVDFVVAHELVHANTLWDVTPVHAGVTLIAAWHAACAQAVYKGKGRTNEPSTAMTRGGWHKPAMGMGRYVMRRILPYTLGLVALPFAVMAYRSHMETRADRLAISLGSTPERRRYMREGALEFLNSRLKFSQTHAVVVGRPFDPTVAKESFHPSISARIANVMKMTE